jgi:hypothetical protein
MTVKLEDLIAEGRLKNKWSEIEDYGIAELVHMLFGYDLSEDSVATTVIVENRTVYLHLYEGITYEHEGENYTLARAYIDVDNNIVYVTPSGVLFLYETRIIDAEDPKHYFGNE